MGNSLPINQYIYVGTNASIQFRRQIHCLEEGKLETWILSYHVGWSVVIFILETAYGKDGLIKLLRFNFYEPGVIEFVIDRAENNLLNQINTRDFERINVTNFVNETKNQWGGVTKTNVAYCGNENVGNLLVVEEKRKRRVEKPCAVTIVHYYAVSSQSLLGLRKYDVGISIVAEIRVLNDDLDVSWKGPSEHPSLALFHMFHRISITRTWMWTACSHCADEIQRTQSSGENGKQFETDNDDEEKNYLQRARKIGGNILANQGMIRGNNNGNFFVNQLILRP